jgi:tetratricopeptide (TPR) repeat protein
MALDTSLNNILAWLRDEPELLAMLRDTYMEQAEIAETASASKNPDIVEKYENVDPAHLYSIAGLISVQANDQEIAAQAYERAVALAPENVNHRLNYTILLSDTHNYDEALAHAQKGLSLAQAQDTQQEAAQFAQLVAIFQDRAAGGE